MSNVLAPTTSPPKSLAIAPASSTLPLEPFITAADLAHMTFPEADLLIEDILPKNLCLLAGPPKIGKSFLCLSFIKHVTRSKQKAYYFTFEDDYRRIQSRLSQLDLHGDNFVIHCGRETQLGSTEAEEFNKIQSIAARDEVSLIVIDTMERILPQTKGKRDYEYYVRYLDNWANLALQTNTCILMVHHTRKGDGSAEYNPQNAILGSVGIAATFDTNLIMERDKNGGYLLHVEGKDIQQNTFKLSKNNVEFSWETKSPTEDLGSTQRQVLQFIQQHQRCTQTKIVHGLGKQKSQISSIVSKLCNEGYIYKEDGLLFISTPP